MKNWKKIACLIFLLAFVLAGISCQQSSASGSTELRGAIHKESDGAGYYILSGGKRYHIDSQQDISAMADKMVNVKGNLTEKDGKRIIVVDSIAE